jgi:uncharacterized membrane protein YhaH (DUF805 family)
MNWYLGVLKKYAVFSGRARRKEYWFFFLFSMIVTIALVVLDIATEGLSPEAGMGSFSGIYTLAVLLPGLAVTVRRLHDTERTGWWLFIALIPLIGAIVLFVFILLDGKPGENKYGEYPKEIAD